MGWFSGWFNKNEPEDYEQVLSALKLDIDKRRTRLGEIRLRERRATLVTTVYAVAAWGLYVSLWYMHALPILSWNLEHLLKPALAFLGPILILLNRRIVQLWYTRKGDAEEKSLKELYGIQQTKIEEIKKKTNYYRTRDIIAKYDETPSSSPSAPAKSQSPQARTVSGQPAMPVTPQRGAGQPAGLATGQTLQTSFRPALQTQLAPSPPQPLPPLRKQWLDKVADAILGDDDSPSAAASRYALICHKCFAHNGLVKESMWEDSQYVCPKCGHFNPSPRSLKSKPQSPVAGPSSNLPSPSSPPNVASHGQATSRQRSPPGPSNLRQVSPMAEMETSPPRSIEGNGVSMDVDT